jgi:carboxypeptidase family protein
VSVWLFGGKGILLAFQVTQSAIVGTIRDGETGEPVTGVVVAVPTAGRAVLSDSVGRYAITSLASGPQRVDVRRIGYAPRTLHVLVPRQGEIEIDITLRRDPLVLRPVRVRPSVMARGTEASGPAEFPDRSMSLDAVRNHPLLEEPDAFVALGGGGVAMRPESPSGLHIRGGASDQTGYLLDGIPIFSPYHAAGTFSAWNPDALERLDLSHVPLASALPDALSGTVAGTTRTPGSRFAAQGSLSTTQARLTLSGPLVSRGSGYVVSIRSGFPGFIAPERESSYLRGESGDLVAKVETPVFRGRGRVLFYDNTNETATAANLTGASSTNDESGSHAFEWRSRSVGVAWNRVLGPIAAGLHGWVATSATDALWEAGRDSALGLSAERRDVGFVATVERNGGETMTLAAVRIRQSRTRYQAGPAGDSNPSFALDAQTPVASILLRHQRDVTRSLTANTSLDLTMARGTTYLVPQAVVRWRQSQRLAVAASYARSQQFTQSLRNAESVVGTIFPADLFVSANGRDVPIARADQGSVAAELRPSDGVRLEAQGYIRNSHGLVLVAPRTGEPFATDGFTTGTGASRGLSLDATVSDARYSIVASYGWQHARIGYRDARYAPDYGAAHLLEGGAIVFPSPTFSIRVGASAELGRRASALTGSFESEGCSLIDRGCEFAGTARVETEQLGTQSLPSYLRFDVGVRKRWDIAVAGRDAEISVFGTVTNLFGRRNVLSFIDNPARSEESRIGMRSLAPLVAGVDWRF